jgi:hypothetical protein
MQLRFGISIHPFQASRSLVIEGRADAPLEEGGWAWRCARQRPNRLGDGSVGRRRVRSAPTDAALSSASSRYPENAAAAGIAQ